MFDDAETALDRARNHEDAAYPGHALRRAPAWMLFPPLAPRFVFPTGCTCFTIGSCFSRNVEEALAEKGFDLPTLSFVSPKTEWPWRHNGLLNEYNPGSIAQRIEHALAGRAFAAETLVETPDGVLDLLLPSPSHAIGVTWARAWARRDEIAAVYRRLVEADVVVITLGMVEAWFDRRAGLFLNRKPPGACVAAEPGRFAFRRLGPGDVHDLLAPAVHGLIAAGVPRILLAVSPVPLNTTFSGREAYGANLYSKSVLRVVAEQLLDRPQVDYLPSYEMVTSGGAAVFTGDNMHIRDEVVRQVVDAMLAAYVEGAASSSAD